MNLPTPSVEYGLLSPMLIVFGAAVAGVLVEAFVSRAAALRRPGGRSASSAWQPRSSRWCSWPVSCTASVGRTAVMGAVAVDAPALFLQGTILLVGILGILLIAERRIPAHAESESESGVRGLDAFTPQASAVVGSVAEKLATKAGVMQTEVFPLTCSPSAACCCSRRPTTC